MSTAQMLFVLFNIYACGAIVMPRKRLFVALVFLTLFALSNFVAVEYVPAGKTVPQEYLF